MASVPKKRHHHRHKSQKNGRGVVMPYLKLAGLKLAGALLLATICAADAQGPAARGTTVAPHPLTTYAPVTDEVLRNPNPNDWIMLRGNYEGYGFSTLKQIDKTNVKGLQLVWARTMAPGVNEGAPLIHDGVMFLHNPDDVVQ